ncbi:MAG: transglutaminase-like domain-containing protein [Phycisphaerae bacterium]|nr:transglutaminase-like domain-containing protein [Phycisphaerae bacterium]MDW8261307.1 transglutaminase-like domain-containing protein [Phycisphaerales bacterium]
MLRAIRFDPLPTGRQRQSGNEYAVWDLQKPPARQEISITARIELIRADLATARGRSPTPAGPATARWLQPERFLESDHLTVQAAAEGLIGPDALATVRAIHDFVLETLEPAPHDPADRGALWSLHHRRGDCSEYSDLFVALCRARRIPAFTCEGFVTTAVADGDTARHQWAEAFIAGVGWTPFDPFHVARGSAQFDELQPTRIRTSIRRNDPNLEGFHQYHFRYWGDPVEVTESFTAREWQEPR